MTTTTTTKSRFPIPVSIHDLEREPYNLLPYPNDFEDDNDEEIRMQSFQKLVHYIEQGNRYLHGNRDGMQQHTMMNLFVPASNEKVNDDMDDDDDDDEPWMDETRMQALYTLVRYVIQMATVQI
jgi:hypothetical protein